MGVLESFGALISGIVAAIVMLVFAILSLFVTVFVVDAAASIGGLEPTADFIVLSAAVLAAAAIVAGGGISMTESP